MVAPRMPSDLPPPELRVVAAAILRGGRVLVALRSARMALPLHWELPGGKVEAGEGDEQALAREIEEELGVRVEVGPCLGESVVDQGPRRIRLVAYRCTLSRGTPRPREHDAVRWITARDFSALRWAPADVPLLPAVAARLGGP